MRWREVQARTAPARMARIAVLTPADRLRDTLVRVAGTGTVELDNPTEVTTEGPAAEALRRLGPVSAPPRLAAAATSPDELVSGGRADLLAGEAQLERYAAGAVTDDGVAGWTAWCPQERLAEVRDRLAGSEAAVVAIRRPAGTDPPTLLRTGSALRDSFVPLVSTYGTVPYRDLDPTVPAGLAYVAMFGVMFADTGHGLLLLLAAVLLRFSPARRTGRLRRAWPFLAGAGLVGAATGAASGEFFGPTGVVPVLWLAPLEHPLEWLAAGIGLGALLLAAAYVVGTVNRWREGGPRLAVYASSGLAGAALFAGLALAAAGLYLGSWAVAGPGAVLAAMALVLAGIGLYAGSGGGGAGVAQTGIELFDLVIRIVANVVSFARLAAFGLTHAALGALVWAGTVALWHAGGPVRGTAAVVLFVVGNAVTFALEAVVAGVQALRLEYYELFSRVFEGAGRPFRPWHVDVEEVSP